MPTDSEGRATNTARLGDDRRDSRARETFPRALRDRLTNSATANTKGGR